jgi:hypothetical protein
MLAVGLAPLVIVRQVLSIGILWLAIACSASLAWARDQTPSTASTREIVRVRDNLYLVRDGEQYTAFVASPEGIILGDPLSRATSLWLREEIGKRFHATVRFVLHSSHQETRAAGSSVFNDTAEIVAHTAFEPALEQAQRDLPERYNFALRVTVVFKRSRVISLGDQTVTVIHVPMPRVPEMTIMHLPRQRVVFAADLPGIGRVPMSFGGLCPDDVFAWVDALSPLDFDELFLGDGRVLSRAAFNDLASYLSALRAVVVRGLNDGRSLSHVEATAPLDRFRTNPHQANRASQLSDLYGSAEPLTLQLSAGAAMSHAQLWPAFCESRTECVGAGSVSAVRIAISTAFRKGLGVTGELTFVRQAMISRSTPTEKEEAATRRSRGAVLVRYSPRPLRFSYALVAGASVTFDDVRGNDQVIGAVRPKGGNHVIAQRYFRLGVTYGADLERMLGRGVAIRMPIRVTHLFGEIPGAYFDSRMDLQGGIELSFRLFQRVVFR